jgi:hypothetical protein
MSAARAPARRGDWMQTYSGRQFWPLDPRPDEVAIEDIAHALSMLCRYGGHAQAFYSVAEHSVHLAGAVAPKNALWALLHDASEAYVGDIVRPLKRHLAGYAEVEARVMAAIAQKYRLEGTMPDEVRICDNRILADEAHYLMLPPPVPWAYTGEPLGVRIQGWPPPIARQRFVETFARLIVERQEVVPC